MKYGDVCYDIDGNEYLYISSINKEGHVVSAVVEIPGSYDEPPHTEFGQPIVISEVFSAPPVQKIDNTILLKKEELAELHKEILDLKKEKLSISNDLKEILQKTSGIPYFKNYVDMLLFPPEYFVLYAHGDYSAEYKIVSNSDYMKTLDIKQIFILNLSLGFKVQDNKFIPEVKFDKNSKCYSGYDIYNMIPSNSYDEAKEILKGILYDKFERFSYSNDIYKLTREFTACEEYGIEIPKHISDERNKMCKIKLQKDLENLEQTLAKTKTEISKITLELYDDIS